MDYNARFYQPSLGCVTQSDAIVPNPNNPQSLNRYAYVSNNPFRFIDPTRQCIPENVWHPDPQTGEYSAKETWAQFEGDPGEIMARAILAEEGLKLGDPYEDDAIGVGWAIKNRYTEYN